MAQAFNLTAQLQLQAPGNTSQVMNQIRRQLKPIGVQVNIQNARNIAQANRSLSSFNKNAQASTKSMGQLNRTLQESARRFSVITIATGSFLALANSFKKSVKEAVAFEREIIKIAQVTGKSVSQLSSLSNEVTRLGTSLGASSADLLNVARTLTQAGFAAEDTRKALDILAKTSLGATFNNIQDTTEGAIALLRQFSNEAKSVGSDVKFLENSLDAINAVSKRFAVESGDLVTAIRRTGGVFSAAGGSVNELIALFTSVRATTRESAETIATGLRTIFTRIQRPESITQLRNFGIELQDAQGNFVGAFEAFKRLSQGLRGLDARSTAFSQIVEDLGGFRQVGKVIPLIQQFTTAQKALSVAQSASGSIAKDAETAQQSLGVQIQKTREEFDALIRKFVDSSAFRSLAKGGLELAKAFIDIANSLEPLLPMLITLAGLKLGRGLAPALGSFAGIGKSVSGAGPVTKFARGGMVPGSGNRDTVPAMLTPGEFVIRKSSVNKIGAGNLAAMNAGRQKYATGGAVELSRNSATVQDLLYRGKRNISKKRGVDFDKSKNMFTEDDTFTSDISKNTISPQKRVVDRLGPKTKSALLNSKNTAAQGDAFEKYLVESGRMTSPKGFGGSNPFDGKSGNELIEVKRTAVADSILLDKNLRHQLKTGNKLNKSKLTGGSDNIKLPPMTELELNKASVESLAQEYKTAKNKKTRKSDPVEDQIGDANFAFGGLVQKYAAGGIIQAKKAGAAILDPEAKNSYSENVTIDDVKKEFGRAATGVKFARGKDPFSKRFSATKFDVTTSGLNKETSDKFKATLNDSLVAGLDYAGASLGADLGVGAVTVDQSTKNNFIKSLRAAQIGDAFENILSTFNNRGVFDSAADPNRPFDFPNGLTSPLADNFDGLPKSFIDAKSSAAAASKDNIRGKILDQIKSELIADGIYDDSPLFKAPRKKALGGTIQKFAKGGAASDTVPALLTPGEFVFNKDAAQSIGYSNLNRMNKQGVQGYAKGGAVGIQSFANGTGPGGVTTGTPFDPNTVGALDEFISKIEEASSTVEDLSDSVSTPREKLKDFSSRLAEGAEKFNRVTQSAQSFVFLGSSVTALTAQFSNLEETTKTAVNRTAAEFAAVVGVLGTFGDIITSLIVLGNRKIQTDLQEKVANDQSAQSEVREKVASDQSAQADLREKVASDAVARADAKRAGTSVITADVGGTTSKAGKAAKVAGAAGAAGAAGRVSGAFGKVGSALGKFGSSLLALVGGPIGLTIAALTGLYLLFRFQANKQKAEFEKLGNAAQDLTNKFIESGENIGSTQNALIAAAKGDVDRRVSELRGRRANITGAISAAGPGARPSQQQLDSIAAINDQIEDLQKNGLDVLTAEIIKTTESFSQMKESVDAQSAAYDRLTSGVLTQDEQNQQRQKLLTDTSAGLTGSQLSAQLPQLGRDILSQDAFSGLQVSGDPREILEDPAKAGEEFASTFRRLQVETKKFELVQKQASRNIQESTSLLNSELQKITSSSQIGDLDIGTSGVAEAFRILKSNIEAEAQARITNLRVLQALSSDDSVKDQLQSEIDGIKDATKERIEVEKKNIEQIGGFIDERAKRSAAEIEERRKFLASLRKVQQNRLALESRTEKIQKRAEKNQRMFDAERGELSTSGQATRFDEDFSGAFDSKKVKREVDAIVSELVSLGGSMEEFSAALEAAKQIKSFSKVYEDLTNEIAGQTDPAAVQKIIEAKLDFADPDVKKQIIKSLQDTLAEGGSLDFGVVTDSLAPLVETINEYRETLDAASDGNQAALDSNAKRLALNTERIQKEINARGRLVDAFARIENTVLEVNALLAQSRGQDPNSEANIAKARDARRRQSQRELIAAEKDLAAQGVKNSKSVVGNVNALEKLKKKYESQLAGLAKIEAADKETQNRIEKLNNGLSAVNRELERIAEGSDVDRLKQSMNENIALIEKERNARSQMISVLEQFVVGSQDVRQNLAQAARGVQFAYGTGTLQNQTPEQRQATVGLLDQLSDVNIAGAFRSAITGQIKEGTGQNIKQELVFRDAIRMGLDPEIAKQLATATSKEEKLIQANENLAAQINNLAGVMQAAAVAIAAPPAPAAAAPPPAAQRGGIFASGGLVQYRADGGSIFKPKGTDTVPAMLTPGEFVIRKSAVDKVGLGTLQAINNGGDAVGLAKGGPVYLDDGGSMPHRHPHPDHKSGGAFLWLSKTQKADTDSAGIPSTHRDFGKGGLQQENALDPHMQNLSSSYKTARNIVTGGDLGQGFTDLYAENFTLNPVEIASGVKEQMDDFDEFQIKAGDAAGSSRLYEKIFGSFGGQTKSEKMDAIKKEMDYVAFARENNIKITEKSIPNLLKQDPGALQRHNDAINEAKKQKAEAARYDLASAKANAQFDPEKNLQAIKDQRADRLRDNFSNDREMRDRIFDGNSPFETGYYTKNKDGRRVVYNESTHQGMSNEEVYMGLTDKELRRLARDFDPNAQAEVDRRRRSQDEEKRRRIYSETLKIRGKAAADEYANKVGLTVGEVDVQTQTVNPGTDEFPIGSFASVGSLLFQRTKARDASAEEKVVDDAYTAMGMTPPRQADVPTPEPAASSDPKRYLPDNDPALVTLRKKQAEAQTEEITSTNLGIDDTQVSTAIQRGGAAARMRERLTGRKTFTDPSRPAGRRTYTSEATKPTTSAERQKQRVARQRKEFAAAQAKKDSEFDVDAFRRARGMRSRGRNPDGSKMNQRRGGSLGGGFMNFLSGYGGYGNQMMGGYGNQMVPFGYIPGSPYNSMLGGGIYNIPMLDKRLMFGNMARFFANGGGVGGDTVPAMLTPGEFVMNKNAVSKYGTGFMRNLNKGKIQGFNKGGPVQYRQNGGGVAGMAGAAQMVDIDTSKIEGVFSSFVDNISSTFDNLVSPLNGVVQSLNQIAQSFGNFTMDHKVSVDGLISLGGLNIESIKSELSTTIGQMVSEEVTKTLNKNNNDFKSA